jgi:microcystin-dependent protein
VNTGVFGGASGAPHPTNAEVQDQRRRANQGPSVTVAQNTADSAQAFAETIALVGMTMGWAGQSDPPGGKWLLCDGRVLSEGSYPLLFGAIGTTWNTGAEGAGNFRIPDCRGRALVGAGAGAGLTNRAVGAAFGAETHDLSISEMPSHDHGDADPVSWTHDHGDGTTSEDTHSHGGDTYVYDVTSYEIVGEFGVGAGSRNVISGVFNSDSGTVSSDTHDHAIADESWTHGHNIPLQGGGAAHNNVQPSIALNVCIRALP